MKYRAPKLQIDETLSRHYGPLRPEQKTERKITWNLFRSMQEIGWPVVAVWDGEEMTEVKDAKEAMELVFNLDESWVYFEDMDFVRHSVLLICGNGEDIISDWRFSDSDRFGSLMDEFVSQIN